MGRDFQDVLAKWNVKHIIPKNTNVKACYAENAIMRIKNKLAKSLSAANNHRWLDCIQDIVRGLNDTFMCSIGMAPSAVTFGNSEAVFKRLYDKPIIAKPQDLAVDDKVRIIYDKGVFAKGNRQRWSEELFLVKKIIYTQRIPCFILHDLKNNEIDGLFYRNELQLFVSKEEPVYDIEKIIRKRRNKGKVEYLVKFKGYNEDFNEWIPHSNLYPRHGR